MNIEIPPVFQVLLFSLLCFFTIWAHTFQTLEKKKVPPVPTVNQKALIPCSFL